MFDYQKILHDNLTIPSINNPLKHDFKDKHLWVKKATGLGVTEFFLRLMAWLCLKDDTCRNSQMCIVTGPNQDIAIKLIKRMKALFEPHNIIFANKETVLELNGCTIEAYPSNHLDAYRALDNPKFILLDEVDFFRKSEQEDVRHVSERYIAKSDPFIVMVSTPNAPGGLFEKIEKELEETCIYKRLKLDYTYGLDKIYTIAEIEKAKQSPSFEREYNLKYLGKIGNVFHTQDIEKAIELGQKYSAEYDTTRDMRNQSNLNITYTATKSLGLDPGYGSSAFGVVATQFIDGQIQIIYADQFERPDFNQMLNVVWNITNYFHFTPENSKIYVDAANPSFIKSLKIQRGEREDYNQAIAEYKHNFPSYDWTTATDMFIIPVNFAQEHKKMLLHAKMLLEDKHGLVAINPKFDKLITSLRTAVEKGEGTLDKESTSYNDIFDAYRLALHHYEKKPVRNVL